MSFKFFEWTLTLKYTAKFDSNARTHCNFIHYTIFIVLIILAWNKIRWYNSKKWDKIKEISGNKCVGFICFTRAVDDFDVLHSQHTVMSFSVGWTASCHDHMLYTGNRAEHKQRAQYCVMFLLLPTHTLNKCTCYPLMAKRARQCCNSFTCYPIIYECTVGNDGSLWIHFKGQHKIHLNKRNSRETRQRFTQPLTS